VDILIATTPVLAQVGALFAASVEDSLFIHYPIKPNYHYVSSSFFKAPAHHPIRITHTRSKVCRYSPQKLPENASIQQK